MKILEKIEWWCEENLGIVPPKKAVTLILLLFFSIIFFLVVFLWSKTGDQGNIEINPEGTLSENI